VIIQGELAASGKAVLWMQSHEFKLRIEETFVLELTAENIIALDL